MSKIHSLKIGLWSLLFLVSLSPAQAEDWPLPFAINDANTAVKFEVDSTWHLIHGTTKNIDGRVWCEAGSNPCAVRFEVSLPVSEFDTENSSRDKRMREILRSAQYPTVSFRSSKIDKLPLPGEISDGIEYPIAIQGIISINGNQRPLQLQGMLVRRDDLFEVRGDGTLSWKDFNVEDPSILIAKLDPTVVLHFNLTLPRN